ncbi:restriction endonuclease [Paenibacillus sp. GbtcB18]|uniref:restriction endonuclease n=1 Tax=Paenibacillus sp. GbtcB18 TaxID=2824763 RepID=UPI001C308588|nr:restriction endonuclease [Paenibacillus sp. GbtcB18]
MINDSTIISLAIIFILFIIVYKAADYFYLDRFCEHQVFNGYRKRRCIECSNALRREEEEKLKAEILQRAIELQDQEARRIHQLRKERAEDFYSLTPREFEQAIANLYKKLGYDVQLTPYVNDGGKDIIAWKNGKKYLIECKKYGPDKKIGRPLLQKLFAAMTEEKAYKGIFVATCYFTDSAYEYGKKYNISCISFSTLSKMLTEAIPDSEKEVEFDQMCLECGDIVSFFIRNGEDRICSKGHVVKKQLPKGYFNP